VGIMRIVHALCILITGIIDLECSAHRLINSIIDLKNARDIRLAMEHYYNLALKDKWGISYNRYNGNKGLMDSNYSPNTSFRISSPQSTIFSGIMGPRRIPGEVEAHWKSEMRARGEWVCL